MNAISYVAFVRALQDGKLAELADAWAAWICGHCGRCPEARVRISNRGYLRCPNCVPREAAPSVRGTQAPATGAAGQTILHRLQARATIERILSWPALQGWHRVGLQAV